MAQVKTDLHMHTHFSPDSRTTPEELVERALAAGLGIIGVTDHNSIRGGFAVRDAAGGRLLVLPGQEVKTVNGEIIVFGLDHDLAPLKLAEETCAAAKAAGGFVLVPNPFDRLRHGIGPLLEHILPYVDLLEVFNSHAKFSGVNAKALAFAEAYHLPATANTDAHRASELGSAYTVLETTLPTTPAEAYEALRTAPRTFHTSGGTLTAFLKRKMGF